MLLAAHAEWQRTASQTFRAPCCTSASALAFPAPRRCPRRRVATAALRGAVKPERLEDEESQWEHSFRIEAPENTSPNFDDDDWYNQVTDWHEFWNHQVWDPAVDGVDDEHDVVAESETSVARAHKLLDFIKDFHKREDFISTFPVVREREAYSDAYKVTPEFFLPDPCPKLSSTDLRAIVDKRRRKALYDAEWQRRKALVGRVPLSRADQERDFRSGRDGDDWDDVKHDWSEEDVMNFITNHGANADPATHGVHIDNPLIPVDFTTTYGIAYIEETEEFASRIGHWLEDDEVVAGEREFVLTEGDVVDFDTLMESDEVRRRLGLLGLPLLPGLWGWGCCCCCCSRSGCCLVAGQQWR
jgi:hypothetical protein